MSWEGAVIPAVQATFSLIGGKEELERARAAARYKVNLHRESSQELFSLIYENLQLYQDYVEPNVDQNDRVFASTVRREMLKTVKRSQNTAQDLDRAKNDPHCGRDQLRALEDKLDGYATLLNGLQLSLTRQA